MAGRYLYVIKRGVKRAQWIIALSAAGCFVFWALVFAEEIPWLRDVYDTAVPAEIRRNFDEYIHGRETCPECMQSVLDGEKFVDIYTKKFIAISFYPNSFGGVWAVIAVEGDPLRAFRLWLYEISPNVYDFRSITELKGYFDENTLHELHGLDFNHFWL